MSNKEPTYYTELDVHAVKYFIKSILHESQSKNEKLIGYLQYVITYNNNIGDFIRAIVGSTPDPIFNVGDKVRVLINDANIYGADIEASRDAGYIVEDGIYFSITKVVVGIRDCYHGVYTYIGSTGSIENRDRTVAQESIIMDNSLQISGPRHNLADLI